MEPNSTLILTLLKAELKNTRLVHGLQYMGLQPDDYYLGISTEVLKMIGFADVEADDELHDFYFMELEKRCSEERDVFMRNLHAYAVEVYNVLLLERLSGMPR